MKAERLTDLGFTKWHPLQEISASDFKDTGEVVFILRYGGTGPRAVPEVRYIGRAKRPLRKILGGIVGGYGGKTTTRIHKKLMTRNTISRINISWKASKDSKAEQNKILGEYKSLNGNVPLWNRKKVKPKATPRRKGPKQPKLTKTAKPTKVAKVQTIKPAPKPAKTPRSTAKAAAKPTGTRRRGRSRKTSV